MKLFDFDSFSASLDTWALIPTSFQHAAIFLPAIEIGLGVMFLLGVRRVLSTVFMLILLVLFTSLYVAHLVFSSKPDCACLGIVASYLKIRDTAVSNIIRNIAIIGLACFFLVGTERTIANIYVKKSRLNTAKTGNHAFSLVETLVTVTVIGVVLAIALPTTALVRQKSRESQYQSRIRSHAQIYQMYTGDHRDWWPNVAEASDRPTWHTINGRQYGIAFYFGQQHVWQYGLAMAYYEGQVGSESFLGRTYIGNNPWDNDYLMSATLLARPEYWNVLTRRGPQQWSGTRVDQVRYPSSKAILMEGATVFGPDFTRRLLGAGADGSASYRDRSDFTDPYPHGDGPFPGTMPSDRGVPGLHTVDGVLGRDW